MAKRPTQCIRLSIFVCLRLEAAMCSSIVAHACPIMGIIVVFWGVFAILALKPDAVRLIIIAFPLSVQTGTKWT